MSYKIIGIIIRNGFSDPLVVFLYSILIQMLAKTVMKYDTEVQLVNSNDTQKDMCVANKTRKGEIV